MPTYDLACASCDTQFERFRQGFLRDDDRICPDCGSHEVTQRFTGFVTTRPTRQSAPTTVTGFGGGGCGGGSCGCGGH